MLRFMGGHGGVGARPCVAGPRHDTAACKRLSHCAARAFPCAVGRLRPVPPTRVAMSHSARVLRTQLRQRLGTGKLHERLCGRVVRCAEIGQSFGMPQAGCLGASVVDELHPGPL
ncbi:hypothetical protein C8243_18060, partial [Paracidovorax avenae]